MDVEADVVIIKNTIGDEWDGVWVVRCWRSVESFNDM